MLIATLYGCTGAESGNVACDRTDDLCYVMLQELQAHPVAKEFARKFEESLSRHHISMESDVNDAGRHITTAFGQAANASLRHCTRTTSFRNAKVLHLVDSQAAASILTRGRTSSAKLRGLSWQFVAIAISSDLCVGIGYINAS